MAETVEVVVAILVGIVLLAVGSSEGERLTRRAWARLFILGATGLSLLPGCRASRGAPTQDGGGTDVPSDKPAAPVSTPEPPPDPGPPIQRWARLGRVWRELNRHVRSQRYTKKRRQEFDELKVEMAQALDALPAWPELRAMLAERAASAEDSFAAHAAEEMGITCYEVAPDAGPMVQHDVTRQVTELEALVAEGRLSQEAGEKAAAALAIQTELTLRSSQADSAGETWQVQEQLWNDYREGRIEAGPGAGLAGKRLAELTVEKLGWLAGPPTENEGMGEQPEKAGSEEEGAKP